MVSFNIFFFTSDSAEEYVYFLDLENTINSMETETALIHSTFERFILKQSNQITLPAYFDENGGLENTVQMYMDLRSGQLKQLFDYLYTLEETNSTTAAKMATTNQVIPSLDTSVKIESAAFRLMKQSACLLLNQSDLNQRPMRRYVIPVKFCESLADGLAKTSFTNTLNWMVSQEKLILAKLLETKDDKDIARIYTSKLFLDYELYSLLIFYEFFDDYHAVFKASISSFNNTVNGTVEEISLFGVLFSSLCLLFGFWYYHRKSMILFQKSMYMVRLIPLQSLTENTYVKSKLIRLLGIRSY